MNCMYMIICQYSGLWCARANTPRHEFLDVCIVLTYRHVVARLLIELCYNTMYASRLLWLKIA